MFVDSGFSREHCLVEIVPAGEGKIYYTLAACSSIGAMGKANTASLDMLDVRTAAALVHRNPETVRRWVWSGRLAAQRRGRRLLVARADVEALVGERTRSVVSLAEWAQRAQASPRHIGARHRARSAADLVLEDRAQRSVGA